MLPKLRSPGLPAILLAIATELVDNRTEDRHKRYDVDAHEDCADTRQLAPHPLRCRIERFFLIVEFRLCVHGWSALPVAARICCHGSKVRCLVAQTTRK